MVKHRQITLSGGGFGFLKWVNKIKNKVEKGVNIGKKVANIYASKEFKNLMKLIPSSDETARAGFTGEQHAILKISPTRFGIANYMGPGTAVVERIKRNDLGRTPADIVAEAHDSMYYLAQLAKTKAEQIKLVREADQHMVDSLKIIKRDKLDFPFNIAIGMRLIQAKMLAEDAGIFEKGSFGGDLTQLPPADVALVKKNLNYLKSNGY